MWGIRLLHNFGKLATPVETSDDGEKAQLSSNAHTKPKRVDEEEAMEGGLKGRISVGAELYFSAKEKSAGGS
jgi:distribution and morphology protein 10